MSALRSLFRCLSLAASQEGEGAEREEHDREQARDDEGHTRGRAEDAQIHTDTGRRDDER